MLGELTMAEVERSLRRGQVGRLGVAGEGRVYIFPVSYGYDGTNTFVVSQEALKVRLMREHPEVCFEVEEIESPARRRTVMAHGRFEEDEVFPSRSDQQAASPPRSSAVGSNPF
jgi:nitroimidazol reductase NimA-like FMN-containing flavoprotein (pyridoxamine 5'-phosphate oxidase superfamily)